MLRRWRAQRLRQVVAYGLLVAFVITLVSPRRVARNIMALQISRYSLYGTRPQGGLLASLLDSTPLGRAMAARDAWTLARWYRARGDRMTSLDYFNGARQQQPHNSLVLLELGTLYDELGQSEAALHWWREADSAGYWDARGMAAIQDQDFASAGAFLARARLVSPTNGLVQYHSGEFYFALSQWDDAIACYSVAIENHHGDDPWLADAYLNRGRALQARGSLVLAETDLLQALSLRPEDPWPYLRLCELYREHERLDDAVARCQQGVSLAPQSGYAYYYLGRAWAAQKRYDRASEALRQALRYDPHLGAAADWLARVERQMELTP